MTTQRDRLAKILATSDDDERWEGWNNIADFLLARDVRVVSTAEIDIARNTLEGLAWEFGEENPRIAVDLDTVIDILLRIRNP